MTLSDINCQDYTRCNVSFRFKTYFSSTVRQVNRLPFPYVKICHSAIESRTVYERITQELNFLNQNNGSLEALLNFTNHSSVLMWTPTEDKDNFLPDPRQFFVRCAWMNAEVNCSEIVSAVEMEYRSCFMVNLNNITNADLLAIGQENGLSIVLDINEDENMLNAFARSHLASNTYMSHSLTHT